MAETDRQILPVGMLGDAVASTSWLNESLQRFDYIHQASIFTIDSPVQP